MVLPWAPATATLYLSRISSASISARGITGIDACWAARTSGLSPLTAEEITTTSAPCTWSAACPSKIAPPRRLRRSVVSDALEVRAGHLVAQVEQQLGNAAHADAADAHEVDVVFFEVHGPSFRSAGRPVGRSARVPGGDESQAVVDDPPGGIGFAELARPGRPGARSASGCAVKCRMRAASSGPLSSRSGIISAAPCSVSAQRVQPLVVVGRVAERGRRRPPCRAR